MEDFLVTFGSPLLPQYPVLNTCIVRAPCGKAAKCLVLDEYEREGFTNYIGVSPRPL